MRFGLVCGSLGARSANGAILRVAAERIGAVGHTSMPIGGIGDIPAFDPELVDDAPDAVAEFRRKIRDCDAVLIAAPEYAAGVAGSTKNALDWLVGDSTVYRRLIGVASAGTTGGPFAIEQLVRTLSWQGGWVVATLGISAPRSKSDDRGEYTDGATVAQINEWADLVIRAAEGSGADRLELLSAVVKPFGIDPARFGDID